VDDIAILKGVDGSLYECEYYGLMDFEIDLIVIRRKKLKKLCSKENLK